MEERYQNRELDEKFHNLDLLIREKHDDSMIKSNEILVQTTKTNGSVAYVRAWIERMKGALVILSIVILPLMTWVLIQVVSLSKEVTLLEAQIK